MGPDTKLFYRENVWLKMIWGKMSFKEFVPKRGEMQV